MGRSTQAGDRATVPSKDTSPAPKRALIPLNQCPALLKGFTPGRRLGFKVFGRYTEDGIEIETVDLL